MRLYDNQIDPSPIKQSVSRSVNVLACLLTGTDTALHLLVLYQLKSNSQSSNQSNDQPDGESTNRSNSQYYFIAYLTFLCLASLCLTLYGCVSINQALVRSTGRSIFSRSGNRAIKEIILVCLLPFGLLMPHIVTLVNHLTTRSGNRSGRHSIDLNIQSNDRIKHFVYEQSISQSIHYLYVWLIIPLIIIQVVYCMTGQSINQSINWINLSSLIISFVCLVIRFMPLFYSVNHSTYIFFILCLIADLSNLYATILFLTLEIPRSSNRSQSSLGEQEANHSVNQTSSEVVTFQPFWLPNYNHAAIFNSMVLSATMCQAITLSINLLIYALALIIRVITDQPLNQPINQLIRNFARFVCHILILGIIYIPVVCFGVCLLTSINWTVVAVFIYIFGNHSLYAKHSRFFRRLNRLIDPSYVEAQLNNRSMKQARTSSAHQSYDPLLNQSPYRSIIRCFFRRLLCYNQLSNDKSNKQTNNQSLNQSKHSILQSNYQPVTQSDIIQMINLILAEKCLLYYPPPVCNCQTIKKQVMIAKEVINQSMFQSVCQTNIRPSHRVVSNSITTPISIKKKFKLDWHSVTKYWCGNLFGALTGWHWAFGGNRPIWLYVYHFAGIFLFVVNLPIWLIAGFYRVIHPLFGTVYELYLDNSTLFSDCVYMIPVVFSFIYVLCFMIMIILLPNVVRFHWNMYNLIMYDLPDFIKPSDKDIIETEVESHVMNRVKSDGPFLQWDPEFDCMDDWPVEAFGRLYSQRLSNEVICVMEEFNILAVPGLREIVLDYLPMSERHIEHHEDENLSWVLKTIIARVKIESNELPEGEELAEIIVPAPPDSPSARAHQSAVMNFTLPSDQGLEEKSEEKSEEKEIDDIKSEDYRMDIVNTMEDLIDHSGAVAISVSRNLTHQNERSDNVTLGILSIQDSHVYLR